MGANELARETGYELPLETVCMRRRAIRGIIRIEVLHGWSLISAEAQNASGWSTLAL